MVSYVKLRHYYKTYKYYSVYVIYVNYVVLMYDKLSKPFWSSLG